MNQEDFTDINKVIEFIKQVDKENSLSEEEIKIKAERYVERQKLVLKARAEFLSKAKKQEPSSTKINHPKPFPFSG